MQETTLSKDDSRITKIDIKAEDFSQRYGFKPDTEARKTASAARQPGPTRA